jgi:dolichol-phosphate mannosyltransferase
MRKINIDIVVAVRNEEKNIPLFVRSIQNLKISTDVELGLIFVEDGSTDKTLEILREYSKQNSKIRYYSLINPCGQAGASSFGIKQSESDAVIMMDVDGSHPVDIIPEMVKSYSEGAEIIYSARKSFTKRKFYRRLGTCLFNLYLAFTAGISIREQNVSFRLISKRIKNRLLQNNRWLYYFRPNFSKKESIKEKYIYFSSQERQIGESKYTFKRLFKIALIAPLSVMSLKRFIIIISLFGLIAVFCFMLGYIILSPLPVGLILIMIFNFYKMSKENILSKLRVVEQSEN